MEERYNEIVYKVLNYVGNDADTIRPSLLKYQQDVFHVDNNIQEKVLQTARERQRPETYLNVSVIDATLLKPTDVNGLSDPYCVLYLASIPSVSYHTSFQFETLNPSWNESFEFLVENPMGDVLCLEIWDLDEGGTIKDMVKKVKEVKNLKGLKVYWKEIKLAASGRNSTNSRNSISSYSQLIGSSLVPLKDISSSGTTIICRLDKNGKVRKQGDLKIHVAFSLKNDKKTAFEQYRCLLYNVVLQELKSTKKDFYLWSGELSSIAQSLTIRHETQCSMSPLHVNLARWIEYVHVHEHHPLNLSLFLPLLKQLVTPLEDDLLDSEEKMLFWEAVTKLLPSCLMAIRRIQMLSLGSKTVTHPLEIMRLVSQLAKISRPSNIDLFPKSTYSCLSESETSNSYTIHTAVAQIITLGANEWFMQTRERYNINGVPDEEEQLNCVIAIIDTLSTSLQSTLDHYEQTFIECFNFSYAEILYKVYQSNIMELVEPIVTHVCKSMKPIKFNDNSEGGIYDNDPLNVGSTLFALYKKLRKLAELGAQVCHEGMDLLFPSKFHEWFNPALVQWLYISSYKAKHQIEYAIKLDCNDNASQTTTSAGDVLGICEQIKIFWNNLAWPEPQINRILLTRVIEDTCECLNFYTELMVVKAKSLIENDPRIADKFRITEEWCMIVNNIRHIQKRVPNFVEGFNLGEAVTSTSRSSSTFSPDEWRHSVLTLINNCIEECNSKIEEMMNTVTEKLSATVSRLFLNVNELRNKTSPDDELLKYLDDNLCMLDKSLPIKDFRQIMNIIWKELCLVIYNLVDSNMKIGRQHSLFIRIQVISEKLLEFISQIPVDFDMNEYSRLKRLLNMNNMNTRTLIHEYYIEQLAKQKVLQVAKYGLLIVKVQFLDDILRLEILSGRHLQPICPSGMCDPYVKIRLLPEEKFTNIGQFKTKILNKTTSPQFEDKFTIQLSKEQRNEQNGMVLFTVKQVVLLKQNYVLGESLLSFDDIPSSSMFSNFDSLGERNQIICRPTINDSEVCSVLKHKNDKLARDFIRLQSNRYPPSR